MPASAGRGHRCWRYRRPPAPCPIRSAGQGWPRANPHPPQGHHGPLTNAKHLHSGAWTTSISCSASVPAGTGKTYLAVAYAAQCLERGQVERIILSRPAVEAGERLGFLPGDMREKVDPYLRPLYDALYDVLPPAKVERDLATGVIEIAPLAFMRGRTLAHSFVILDEAQNTSAMQMKMFLTRIGEGSKMVDHRRPEPDRPAVGAEVGPRGSRRLLTAIKGIEAVRFTSARRGAPRSRRAHRRGLRQSRQETASVVHRL